MGARNWGVEGLEPRVLLSVATLFGVRATRVDDGPAPVVVADFDVDGKLDVLTVDSGTTVLRGNGDGTFADPPRTVSPFGSVDGSPPAAAVADLNGDDRPDIVVSSGGGIGVLINQGNLTFKDALTFPTTDIRALALADVNNDGRFDILTTDPFYKRVGVMLGKADGTYRAMQTFPAGTTPQAMVARDFDGDGNQDLAVANLNDDTVSLLMGNGNGTFQDQRTYAVGHRPSDLAVRDLDRNGTLDLVTPDGGDDTVSVLLGNGDGTFQARRTFAAGDSPVAVSVGDVNGDGKRDLVTANSINDTHTLTVLLGKGDGTFQPQQTFNAAAAPKDLGVGDFNGDGFVDLVTANAPSTVVPGTISLYLGNGDGTFPTQSHFRVGIQPSAVATADFDHDGHADVAVANSIGAPGTIGVLLGNGDGSLKPQQAYAAGSQPDFVVAADVNHDTFADLVVASELSSAVGVLLNLGNGTFAPQKSFPVGNRPQWVAAGDVDGDGNMDLVAANTGANTLSLLRGNGDGTFQPQQVLACDASPQAVAIGDVTGDGKADIVSVSQETDRAAIIPGNQDGTFQATRFVATSDDPRTLLLVDVNADGRNDVVTSSDYSFDVGVLVANAVGGFQKTRLYYLGHTAPALAAADVNGDGRPDLVTVNPVQNTASVLLNGGSLASLYPDDPLDFNAGDGPVGVALPDLNGDGRPDLVTADNNASSVSTVLNLGNGTPVARLLNGTLFVNLFQAGASVVIGQDGDTGMLTVTGPDGSAAFSAAGVGSITLLGTIADDSVTFADAPSAPITLVGFGGRDVIDVGAGTLTLAGGGTTGPRVNVASGARVVLTAAQHLAGLHLASDALARAAAGEQATLVLGALTLDAGARMDLADNDMIVRGGDLANISDAIRSARTAAGDWSGIGITSSTAANDPGHETTLAAALAGALNLTALGDEPLGGADVVVRYTLAGDATLDRSVDFNDLVRLAQNYNSGGGKTCTDGDFTGDGIVDFNDLVLLAQHYNDTLTPPAPVPAAVVAPPAPTPQKRKPKPRPVFSVTPVAGPVKAKVRAGGSRRA